MGPSRHKSIARYTDITFEGISTRDYVSLCVFLISSDSRTGKWDRILPNDRFTISDEFTWSNEVYQGKMRSYCKTLPESPTSAPSSMPSCHHRTYLILFQRSIVFCLFTGSVFLEHLMLKQPLIIQD